MSAEHAYDSVAWGRQLDKRDPDWLGDVDSHARAWPRRLAQARMYYKELDLQDFDVRQTGPDRFSLVDKATGLEYRPVGYDPLQNPNPTRDNIHGFLIDGADMLIFLKPRGAPDAPVEEVFMGTVTLREVSA
jgi:hypothetical protein